MKPIYLDYQATTPLASEVVAVMQEFFHGEFGNPHSLEHSFGQRAAARVETARACVARSIGARSSEVIFTSGATEANNTAIKGVLSPAKGHVITCETEHQCVLSATQQAPSHTLLRPDADGLLDPEQVRAAITPDTAMISVMLVNNEIGVIQPIAEIAQVCRKNGVLMHVDASQALGRVAIDVRSLAVDLLSLSGHKIYGPKGIGALFIRRGVQVNPLLHGGGQERKLRSGTLSPMLCAGFGVASELAAKIFVSEQERAGGLVGMLLQSLDQQGVDYSVNGSRSRRVADNLNLHFPRTEQAHFMSSLREIAVSSSAACSSASAGGSHVLRALGHDESVVATNIRLSIGRPTTEEQVLQAALAIATAWKSARS